MPATDTAEELQREIRLYQRVVRDKVEHEREQLAQIKELESTIYDAVETRAKMRKLIERLASALQSYRDMTPGEMPTVDALLEEAATFTTK